MSKCLVTKLKASVDNPNLPLFGVFNIQMTKSSSTATFNEIILGNQEPCEFSVDAGQLYNANNEPIGTKLSVGAGVGGHFRQMNEQSVDTYNLKVTNKYGLTKILMNQNRWATVDWNDLKYCTNLELLEAYMVQSPTEVDLSEFHDISKLKTFNLGHTHLTVYFPTLVRMDNIATTDRLLFGETSGTIEEFVEAARAEGKTSGTFPFWQYQGGVTYKGNRLGVGNENKFTLTWTADSIELKQNDTIL